MMTNVIVIIGAGMTLVPNFYVFLIGRFLYGVASGGFSCFCPKYISEVSPTEVAGPAGGMTQMAICFGLLVPFLIGMGFGIDPTEKPPYDTDKANLALWIIFALPIPLALIQMLLMMCIFKYDTPSMLK